jgi:beta-carotene 3-hydroxylase
MHGPGWAVHADHHTSRRGGWQRNDLYPASFSVLAVGLFAAGTSGSGHPVLVAAGVGMTAYGVAYLYVHEVCIHGRLPIGRRLGRYSSWLRRMHRVHHLYGGEPYGMLLPLVPGELRRRATADERDPLARTASMRDSRSRL